MSRTCKIYSENFKEKYFCEICRWDDKVKITLRDKFEDIFLVFVGQNNVR
jgi:hypothetical protein